MTCRPVFLDFARSLCSVGQTSRSHSRPTTFCVPCGSVRVRSPQRPALSLPRLSHARVLCHVARPSFSHPGLARTSSPPQQLAYSATQVPFITTSATLRQFSSARSTHPPRSPCLPALRHVTYPLPSVAQLRWHPHVLSPFSPSTLVLAQLVSLLFGDVRSHPLVH